MNIDTYPTAWKVSKYGVLSGLYFRAFTGKYGLEKNSVFGHNSHQLLYHFRGFEYRIKQACSGRVHEGLFFEKIRQRLQKNLDKPLVWYATKDITGFTYTGLSNLYKIAITNLKVHFKKTGSYLIFKSQRNSFHEKAIKTLLCRYFVWTTYASKIALQTTAY